jgi:hypothetical protein
VGLFSSATAFFGKTDKGRRRRRLVFVATNIGKKQQQKLEKITKTNAEHE